MSYFKSNKIYPSRFILLPKKLNAFSQKNIFSTHSGKIGLFLFKRGINLNTLDGYNLG